MVSNNSFLAIKGGGINVELLESSREQIENLQSEISFLREEVKKKKSY